MAIVQAPDFGTLLRRWRRAAGLTQEELAERAGLSARGISDLERGLKRRPHRDTVQLLADALRLTGEARGSFEAAGRALHSTVQGEPTQSVQTRPPSTEVEPAAHVSIFLIADVRGYTRFTLEHGDEAAARLVERFAELTEEVVVAREGLVLELRGDEALVVFSSARQALRSAVEMQGRFAEEERHPSCPLRVGIGLDAGEALPVKGGYRGAALNLAARLCQLAGSGEVLASESVMHLARRIEGLEYAERGFSQLKGFTEPIRVIEVRPSAPSPPRVPPPRREEGETDSGSLPSPRMGEGRGVRGLPIGGFLGALPAGSLIGREDELRRLLASVDVVVGGSGQVVVLAGEPGVGKTRLAQEATLHLRNRGFLVAAGRCYEGDQSVPYYPFREALETLFAGSSPAIRAAVAAQWPDVRRLLPGNGAGASGVLSHGQEDARERLFWSVTGFLSAVAESEPVALLFDDMHWADGSSLALLRHLADHTRSHRVLLIGTYRDVEVGRHHPLEGVLRDLGREQLVNRIHLSRLSQEATATLVADAMGESGVPDDFAELVHRWTEGNPFFIQQVLRALVERGDVHRKDGHWVPGALEDLEIPESVRSVIGQRVSRLNDFTQEVLLEASVLGQAFFFDDLQTIGNRDETALEQALEEARQAGLIQEAGPDGYTFDHALTQQTFYGELPARRKRRLHLAAGSTLESLPERPRGERAAEIAVHFIRGGAGDRALPYFTLAGDQAESVFAYAEAESQFRSALELADDLGDRERAAEAMEKLGRVLFSVAQVPESLSILDSAAQTYAALDDRRGEIQVLARVGWTLYELGRRQEGIDRLLPALKRWREESAPASAEAASLHIALASLYWASGQPDEALSLANAASEMARAVGDRRLLGDAQGRRGLVLIALNRQDEGLQAYGEAIAMAEATGDLANLIRTLNNRAVVFGDRGDRVREWADMEQALDVGKRMGSPIHIAFSLVHMGEVARVEGDWDRAEASLDQAVAVLRGVQATRASAGADLAGLRMLRGSPNALADLQDLAATGERNNNLPLYLRASHWLAEWDLLQDRPDAARVRLEAILAHPGLEEQYRAASQWALVRALLALEDLDQVEAMIEENLRHAARPRDLAGWRQLLGCLRTRQERWKEARSGFEDALRWTRDAGNVFREALTLYDLGLMHAARGETDAARGRLNEALTIFTRLGARLHADGTEMALGGLEP